MREVSAVERGFVAHCACGWAGPARPSEDAATTAHLVHAMAPLDDMRLDVLRFTSPLGHTSVPKVDGAADGA